MSVIEKNLLYPSMESIPRQFQITCRNEARCLINGKIIPAPGKEVYSPIQYRESAVIKNYRLGYTPWLDPSQALDAIKAAELAYDYGWGVWPQMTIKERIHCVEEFALRMQDLQEGFICQVMWEIAKPYQSSKDEFQRTLKYMEETIIHLRELDKNAAKIHQIEGFAAQIRRSPLGPVLLMGPFNYPLNEAFAMFIPALIMGNTVVMKLPSWGCLCLDPFLDLLADSFPPGVVNIINGEGSKIIPPIVERGSINVLGFIGTTAVANKIIADHPYNNRLRTILGLEAKNPAFVFPDCDLELTVQECLQGALEFNGQRCTSLKHIWVHEEICERFLDALSQAVAKIKYGMPWDQDVLLTPLAEEGKCERLLHWIYQAEEHGAKTVNPGGGEYAGNLFYPSILFPVTREMDIYHVEQFGPVIPVSSFRSLDDIAVYLAECQFGQQASIFTNSAQMAAPLIDILAHQVSRVNLNAQCRRGPDELPFTGRKDSAEGTLSIVDALRAFSIRSLVVANEHGKELFNKILAADNCKFLHR
ncbi:Aldehyde/histidinol dehydrogenase [Syntrophomonas zehnderi OL-4]|uniref:Aldehyde/histidinol dehydrogenase n=1 Tax=Syntrophomonas zehnderi OL-4 TaxID=690567 RepID=A0A0E3W3Y1_9FIRM|nr:aldehyde dehydrogenase family protein [Syntrophomonas zehnderi]CFY11795.1 Aldehyde/histidinol dehydrogenase [Syntrophomonas zehnderi OL-4]